MTKKHLLLIQIHHLTFAVRCGFYCQQFLYEAGYGHAGGVTGMIGCTQPRRVAAVTTAKRVALELNVPLGKQVGFQVTLTHRSAPPSHTFSPSHPIPPSPHDDLGMNCVSESLPLPCVLLLWSSAPHGLSLSLPGVRLPFLFPRATWFSSPLSLPSR